MTGSDSGRPAEDAALIRDFLAGRGEAVFRLTRWVGLELRSHRVPVAARLREDLIQETLMRLWVVLGRREYRAESGLQRYVRAIARNVVVDHLRKKTHREVTGEVELATEIAGETDVNERLADRDSVARLLAGLSEEDGRLLVEAYVEERPYVEMAAARGIRRGTLKVRVFRAARRAQEAWARMRDAGAGLVGRASGAEG